MTVLSFISDRSSSPEAVLEAPKPQIAFPFGLGDKGVHECVEARHGDMGAMTGFLLANANAPEAVLWVKQYRLIQEHGQSLSRGMRAFTPMMGHCLHVRASKRLDALWAIEEGAKSGGVQLVVGEVEDADFTATRRLKLISEAYGVPIILLMPHTRQGTSACETRWRISAQPSALNPFDKKAPGKARWRAVLERCRTAPERTGETFDLEYDDEALSLRVVSRLAAGSVAPSQTPANEGTVATLKASA